MCFVDTSFIPKLKVDITYQDLIEFLHKKWEKKSSQVLMEAVTEKIQLFEDSKGIELLEHYGCV